MPRYSGFVLPPLPYPVEALSPAIGAGTLSVHHDRIFGAHIDALNILLDGLPVLRGLSAETLLTARRLPPRDAGAIRWHAGAVLAHTLYFRSVCLPCDGYPEPGRSLSARIKRDIGSYAELCFRFREAALSLRGPGFLYLVLAPRGGQLRLLPYRDTGWPSLAEGLPLLCMDLWEHAYFSDHAEDRISAVNAFLSVVDWEGAERRMNTWTSKQQT